jgi:high-affinity Fe2+/Pb2+ permease
MQFIADILLGAGAFGAAFYCMVLARRLKRFNQLETGMGGAIAVLSAQVDDMTKALVSAQATASNASQQLNLLTKRAEQGAERLEILLASLHDLPEPDDLSPRQRVLRRRPRIDAEAEE